MKHEFQNLNVWTRSRELNKEIYLLTEDFPPFEKYGLVNQIRRATISISSNIAEGSAFESDSQFIKYLFISLGSLCEVESQLYLSFDLNYISQQQLDDFIQKTDEIKRMVLGLKKSLKMKNWKNPKFLFLYGLFYLSII